MTEYQYVKELLSTGIGAEGTLLLPRKIYDTILDEAIKNLIPRSEYALYGGPAQIPGASWDLNLHTLNSMSVRVVGEGAEVPLDNTEFSNLNLKPLKYGVTVKITKEMMEDSQFDLLAWNLKIAGRRMAEQETSIVVTGALDSAGNTVTGGATISVANITRAIQYLEDSDFTATTFFVGKEVLNDLRNLDTFVEYQKRGDTQVLDTGTFGKIYGMNVIPISTNAGMTATSSYVCDKNYAIAFAEKRPLTVENFDMPTHDMKAVTITARFIAKNIRSASVAKITTT